MGILNTHQILAGARRFSTNELYVKGGITVAPSALTVSANRTITPTGGEVEFNGKRLATPAVTIPAAILDTAKTYLLAAVPAYTEPVSKAAAETAGTNYFVETSEQGESIARFFLPTALEAAVAAVGGYEDLSTLVFNGSATVAQIQLFNEYEDAIQRLSDPRYVGTLLPVTAVKYIVAEIGAQDNASTTDVLADITAADFYALQARVNLYVRRVELSATSLSSTAQINARKFKVAKAFADSTAELANTRLTDLTTRTYADGEIVYEYYYPSFMPLGQQGTLPKLNRVYTNVDDTAFGRINPIYFGSAMDIARMPRGLRSALTLVGDPVAVGTFGWSGTSINATAVTPDRLIG